MEQNLTQLNIVSLNIRYQNDHDEPNSWNARLPIFTSTINSLQPDILAMQEVTPPQLKDIQEHVSEYEYVGEGRSDHPMTELSPIFFNKNILNLISSTTKWLSSTPDIKYSHGWDAYLNRIVTICHLSTKHPPHKEIVVASTHFDHRGVAAQKESSKLIKKLLFKEQNGELPIILLGDFNSTPNSEAYKILSSLSGEEDSVVLFDATKISETPPIGENYTFNGFSETKGHKIIDYIMVNNKVKVKSFEVRKIKQNGIYISDHFPLISKIIF